MSQKIYNKLIRDKIPEVMDQAGKTYEIIELKDAEYREALLRKLIEETDEVVQSDGHISEIADALEVLHAICALDGHSWKDVEDARKDKADKRGAFVKRLFLIEGDV